MKNKRNFIAFILLLLPLLVAVGMSTWIILNESLLTPSYNPDPVIKKYFSGEESVVYDGDEHAPVTSVENLIEFGDLEFSYKPILDTTTNYAIAFATVYDGFSYDSVHGSAVVYH